MTPLKPDIVEAERSKERFSQSLKESGIEPLSISLRDESKTIANPNLKPFRMVVKMPVSSSMETLSKIPSVWENYPTIIISVAEDGTEITYDHD